MLFSAVEYRRRPARGRRAPSLLSLIVSVAIHGSFIALVLSAPFSVSRPSPFLGKNLVLIPVQKKLTWVPAKTLPKVSPLKRSLSKEVSEAASEMKQTIGTTTPQPVPAEQLILQHAPELTFREQIRTPNVLLLRKTVPKVKPETERKPLPDPPVLELSALDPRVADSLRRYVDTSALQQKPKPKPFQAPALVKPAPSAKPLPLLPAPADLKADASRFAVPAAAGDLTAALSRKPPPKPFIAPVSKKGRASSGSAVALAAPDYQLHGANSVDLAIISLQPSMRFDAPVPEGSQPAQVSGPRQSNPGGAAEPDEIARIRARDLVIQGGRRELPAGARTLDTPKAIPPPPDADQILDGWQSEVRHSLSAPLRPGARVIPPLIEARFADRIAYTTSFVILGEGNESPAKWVLWFAEHSPAQNRVFTMRPPVPWRPLRDAVSLKLNAPGTRVVLSAVVQRNGLVVNAVALSGPGDAMESVLAMLKIWQFLPAVRNSEAVDVDAVIEISSR
jgi:hypothetical protein